jgi:hypothetical protein
LKGEFLTGLLRRAVNKIYRIGGRQILDGRDMKGAAHGSKWVKLAGRPVADSPDEWVGWGALNLACKAWRLG